MSARRLTRSMRKSILNTPGRKTLRDPLDEDFDFADTPMMFNPPASAEKVEGNKEENDCNDDDLFLEKSDDEQSNEIHELQTTYQRQMLEQEQWKSPAKSQQEESLQEESLQEESLQEESLQEKPLVEESPVKESPAEGSFAKDSVVEEPLVEKPTKRSSARTNLRTEPFKHRDQVEPPATSSGISHGKKRAGKAPLRSQSIKKPRLTVPKSPRFQNGASASTRSSSRTVSKTEPRDRMTAVEREMQEIEKKRKEVRRTIARNRRYREKTQSAPKSVAAQQSARRPNPKLERFKNMIGPAGAENSNIQKTIENSGMMGVPKASRRKVTVAKPFEFASDKLAASRARRTKEKENAKPTL